MTQALKPQVRYTKRAQPKLVKMGGHVLVSKALVKHGATNLVPKIHVKRGDMVMLMSGAADKGKTGKVINVFPRAGKIVVEGLNMITRATKKKGPMGTSGLIKKEGPIFTSRVMLFCTACKKPTRIQHSIAAGGKKSRVCKHCKEAFDA